MLQRSSLSPPVQRVGGVEDSPATVRSLETDNDGDWTQQLAGSKEDGDWSPRVVATPQEWKVTGPLPATSSNAHSPPSGGTTGTGDWSPMPPPESSAGGDITHVSDPPSPPTNADSVGFFVSSRPAGSAERGRAISPPPATATPAKNRPATGLAPTDISGVAYAHGISPEPPSPMTHNNTGVTTQNNSVLEIESPHMPMVEMPGFTDMEKKLAPGQTALMSDRLASGQTALASPGPEIEYSDYPTPQQANIAVTPGPGIEYSDYATPQPSAETPLMSIVPPSSLPTPSTPSASRESVTKAFDEVRMEALVQAEISAVRHVVVAGGDGAHEYLTCLLTLVTLQEDEEKLGPGSLAFATAVGSAATTVTQARKCNAFRDGLLRGFANCNRLVYESGKRAGVKTKPAQLRRFTILSQQFSEAGGMLLKGGKLVDRAAVLAKFDGVVQSMYSTVVNSTTSGGSLQQQQQQREQQVASGDYTSVPTTVNGMQNGGSGAAGGQEAVHVGGVNGSGKMAIVYPMMPAQAHKQSEEHAENATVHAVSHQGEGDAVYSGSEAGRGGGGGVSGPLEQNVASLDHVHMGLGAGSNFQSSHEVRGVENQAVGGGGGIVFGHERPAPLHHRTMSYLRNLFSCCSSEPHSQALDDDILNPSHTRVKRPAPGTKKRKQEDPKKAARGPGGRQQYHNQHAPPADLLHTPRFEEPASSTAPVPAPPPLIIQARREYEREQQQQQHLGHGMHNVGNGNNINSNSANGIAPAAPALLPQHAVGSVQHAFAKAPPPPLLPQPWSSGNSLGGGSAYGMEHSPKKKGGGLEWGGLPTPVAATPHAAYVGGVQQGFA